MWPTLNGDKGHYLGNLLEASIDSVDHVSSLRYLGDVSDFEEFHEPWNIFDTMTVENVLTCRRNCRVRNELFQPGRPSSALSKGKSRFVMSGATVILARLSISTPRQSSKPQRTDHYLFSTAHFSELCIFHYYRFLFHFCYRACLFF